MPEEGRVLTLAKTACYKPGGGLGLDAQNKVFYLENNELQLGTESPSQEVGMGSLSPHFWRDSL
jgi:hypothetical protein